MEQGATRDRGLGRRATQLALLSAVSLGVLAGAPVAIAQTAPADTAAKAEAKADGDIIVTARRKDERLIDAPVAITALTGASLDQYAISRFTDIATQVPSLVMGKAASGSSASIFLRGVGSTALSAGFDQSVSFIVDGLPMSRGREIGLSQYDVQRVEVLKGPQALYYGKNTTGGLIAVATNDPGDQFEAGAKAGYGVEAKEKYAEGYVSGPITETLGARFAFRVSDSDGAFDNSAAPVFLDPLGMQRLRTDEKRGGSELKSGRLTLAWKPTSSASFTLKTGATQVKDGGPTDILERICGGGRTVPATSNGVPPSPRADCSINGVADASTLPRAVAATIRWGRDGKEYADLDSSFAVLNSNLEFSKVDVSSITSYYRFKQTDLNNVAGEHYPASFSQYAKFDQMAEELRFQTKFDGPFNLMFGVFGSKANFDFDTDAYIFIVPADPSGTYVTFKRDNGFKAKTLSAFAEGTYEFQDQWELSAGARWSREERDSFQQSLPASVFFAGFFPGNIRIQDSFKDENISPQVTLRYKPSRDVTYYAAYKEGFKAGGFNISQSLTPAASLAAGQYGSETASGFEAGLRTLLFDRAMSLNVTAYDYVYKDLQVQKFDPVTIGQVVDNAGELTTKGIEAEVDWKIVSVPGLSVRAAGAYNDASFDKYIGQCYGGQTIANGCNLVPNAGVFTSQSYNGKTPPKAPKFSGRVGGSYERSVFGNLTAVASADVSYTSKYNFTDTLRPDGEQPAYTKVDAAFRLLGPGEKWSVALIGRNLTEEYVVTAANDIPFTGGTGTGTTAGVLSDMSAFVDNPREVYIEVALKF